MRRTIPFGTTNFLSVFTGVEGGFAIFAGIVLGLSFGDVPRNVLIASAVISIVVNALNSATIRYSSEHYLDELDGRETTHVRQRYLWPALVEFFSYVIVSVISIIPLIIVNDLQLALLWMCSVTIFVLFLAGWYRGHLLVKRHSVADGFEVLFGGVIIMLAGATAGWVLNTIF
jgi:VIT1/CCC1 family predicted Fe2+/Mn2+ transporter